MPRLFQLLENEYLSLYFPSYLSKSFKAVVTTIENGFKKWSMVTHMYCHTLSFNVIGIWKYTCKLLATCTRVIKRFQTSWLPLSFSFSSFPLFLPMKCNSFPHTFSPCLLHKFFSLNLYEFSVCYYIAT